ncbi:hypothetical protein K457DRAFT_433022 [Linnemannia elongata AG-77]|uniref:VASt domain-containing protein n=1 Tax=Linnemannia elongata AG-77 TaxID=1314771 RepID=A0A197K009_9FUNG|nr:hypothetical protein K457DRAFT_433022 [Linnemannia elongata AG-77]
MVSLQPETMTMEAFQMNGGSIQYEPYETDNNLPVTQAQGGSGPGSFPESYGADGQEYSYDGDAGYSQAGSTSSQNDGDDYSAANINFVYANEKRFSDFHSVFRSVPDEEKLIEDYGCALQKEILVQGRLYISENHVCFNANIFGWVTNLVIAFSEITAIEKRLTAFVIPNAISIVTTTNTKGHFFASFLSRDAAHDLLMAAWRKSFPCAANASAAHNNAYFRQNRSNVTLHDDDDADSFISARPASDSRRNRHRRSSSASQNWTADEADWETGEDMDGKSSVGSRRRGSKRSTVKKIFKEVIAPILPDDDGRHGTATESTRKGRGRSQSELPPRPTSFDFKQQASPTSKSTFDLEDHPRSGRSASESAPNSLSIKTNGHAAANGSAPAAAASSSSADGGAPAGAGANHAPTTCKCSKDGRHYANSFLSETYPGTVESMWKLLFDSNFSKSFLTNEAMKGADVQEEAWKDAGDGTSTKVTKYTKWLGMPIGPKTTKAILTDVCEYKNFDDHVSTVTTTSTPDVPSGGSFTTKCRTCITWAGPNQVLVVVTGAVEFTKSSWIKGQIEKGAAEGMGTHYKELNSSIRKHIAAHPEEFGGASTGSASVPSTSDASRRAPTPSRTTIPTQDRARTKQNHQHAPAQPSMENGKSEKGHAITAQQSAGKNGTSGGAAGLLSSIMASFSTGPDGEGASHMALMAVLVIVMLANVYIWFQISSVTSQIEKIQSDVFAEQRGGGSRSHMAPPSKGGYYGGVEYDSFGDNGYTRDQEEAMWAWLTEREERHRRYQRAAAGREWNRMRKQERNDNDNDSDFNDHTSSTSSSSSSASALTEAKLQARINELQQQLEALEKAVERGSASQEL